MSPENAFHADQFKRIRNLFPNTTIPTRIPKPPKRKLGDTDRDIFEQRRLAFLPARRILQHAVPVLTEWRGNGSAFAGLQTRQRNTFTRLPYDGRAFFRMACGCSDFAPQAEAEVVEIIAATLTAACERVSRKRALASSVRLLNHPNLAMPTHKQSNRLREYIYNVSFVGGRIMVTFVRQVFAFMNGDLTRAIAVAGRSEPLILQGSALAAKGANILYNTTSGSSGKLSDRGFLRPEDLELVDIPNLGEILRLKESVLEEVVTQLELFFSGTPPATNSMGRLGCVALYVRVGELNLVQFIYRWLLDALLEAKS